MTRSQTAREMYVDSQMGIITSVPEDAAQLQLKKTSSEDKTKYEFYWYITPE